MAARGCRCRLTGAPAFPWATVQRGQEAVGGHNGWLDIYGLMSLSKLRFFSPRDAGAGSRDHVPYEDLELNRERLQRWHPLNRALYLGGRVHAARAAAQRQGRPGGDALVGRDALPVPRRGRVRLPGQAAPALEAARAVSDKYLLRQVAERWLPQADRLAAQGDVPRPVRQLPPRRRRRRSSSSCSARSRCGKTGYFDAEAVRALAAGVPRAARRRGCSGPSVEMGLVGVLATQLWHHTFIDGSLADLPEPGRSAQRPVGDAAVASLPRRETSAGRAGSPARMASG